jgi:hypothetical protein
MNSVIQGVFFSRASLTLSRTVLQRKAAIQLRPGTDAFPVNLTRKMGGMSLPREVQTKLESALGTSFSDVRVHVGSEAASIGAIAFTWGTDIHFAPGQYNPHTQQGQMLLAHELVHVVQQRAGRVKNPFGNGVAVVQDAMLEAEADRLGREAAMSQMPQVATVSGNSATATAGAATTINRKVNPMRMTGTAHLVSRSPSGAPSVYRAQPVTGTLQPKTRIPSPTSLRSGVVQPSRAQQEQWTRQRQMLMLMVMLGNLAQGQDAFEDLDDMAEDPDIGVQGLPGEAEQRRMAKAEKRAQRSARKAQQRNEKWRQKK